MMSASAVSSPAIANSASAVSSPAIASSASAVFKLICASAEPFEFYLMTKQISDVVDAIEDHGGPAQIWKRNEVYELYAHTRKSVANCNSIRRSW